MMASIQFYENGVPSIMQNGGNYAKFKFVSEFRHNHHSSGVKILANFIQRGFWSNQVLFTVRTPYPYTTQRNACGEGHTLTTGRAEVQPGMVRRYLCLVINNFFAIFGRADFIFKFSSALSA
jgi:hypothetical protein